MNVIVLHGDNLFASSKRLKKFIDTAKSRGWQIQRLSKSTNLAGLDSLLTETIFKDVRFFILEDPASFSKKDTAFLKRATNNLEGTLVIYHTGALPKRLLNSLPKATKIEEYKLPRLIFKFLESFYPGNAKNAINLLRESSKNEAPELVFHLLARHLRDLYIAKEDKNGLSYPTWRIAKLKSQATRFTNNKLKAIVFKLSELDIRVKTTKDELIDSLDLFIATNLQ